MEQSTLRQWEAKCIQEEAPACQASCPLHVDARSFCREASAGQWDKGRALLARTMPLPGIMARLCHGPCQLACRRKEKGGAVQMPALEKAAFVWGKEGLKPKALPSTKKQVAIVGQGLAALTAAWDLSRKGHLVTLFSSNNPAGDLADHLPAEIISEELATLASWNVTFKKQVSEMPVDSFMAVLWVEPEEPLYQAASHYPAIDDYTRQHLDHPQLFFASLGFNSAQAGKDFIYQASAGRLAAVTVDRFLGQVSLSAGREKQGPYVCGLYTNLNEVKPEDPVALPLSYDNPEQFAAEASRCLDCQCLECAHYCAFLAKYGGYPKKYARNIYNNLSIVKGHRQANRFINSCSLCGLCFEVCPTGFNMAQLCRQARQEMVAQGAMPPSTHDFALRDMAQANSDEAMLVRPPHGRSSCSWLFMPGCQLAGRKPYLVGETFAWLQDKLGDTVGIALACCGAPAKWAGRDDLAREAMLKFKVLWEEIGQPIILTACPACTQTLAEYVPELTVQSLWTVMADKVQPVKANGGAELVLSDPCTARLDEPLQASVRQLLTGLKVKFKEAPDNKRFSECCGFGGLMAEADPELANLVIQNRVQRINAPTVTYCAVCRDRMAAASPEPIHHLLDLMFFNDSMLDVPGISDIQEQRVKLKLSITERFYGEKAVLPDSDIRLNISQELQRVMDKRRILTSDLQKVICEAEKQNRWFLNKDTGSRLACLRFARVTYWAEYMPANGPEVHAAWSHRMLLPETVKDNEPLPNEPTYLPETANWVCSCGQNPRPHSLALSYLNSSFNVNLLACPACNLVLVPESLALGKMKEVELLLEDK